MEKLTLMILAFALIIVPISSKVCQVDINGYWAVTDFEFATKYDFIEVIGTMNTQALNLNTAMMTHSTDITVGIELWALTAGITYIGAANVHLSVLHTHSSIRGMPELISFVSPLNTVINEASQEVQAVATILSKGAGEYRKSTDTGLKSAKVRFNENTEACYSDVGEASKASNSKPACVKGVIRTMTMIVETHHGETAQYIKDTKADENLIFGLVEDIKSLPTDFFTKIIEPAMNCIDSAWVNGGVEKAKRCIEPLLKIKGTDLIETEALSKEAKAIGETSANSLVGKASDLTDTESAKVDQALDALKKCFDQGTTTTTTAPIEE